MTESSAARLKEKLGASLLSVRESAPGENEYTIDAAHAVEALKFLKSSDGGGFDHLSDLTAYDVRPSSPRYNVVYELLSMGLRTRCSVIVPAGSDSEPTVESVTSLWAGANWLEREVFDMYGIQFTGHPDMRRILLPASFQGHPLRRDFTLDYRQKFNDPNMDDASFDPFGSTLITPGKG